MTLTEAITALGADPAKAAAMARHHRIDRPYLGVPTPAVEQVVKTWRSALDLPARLALADALWASNIHEARIAAIRLLTQARIRPDDTPVWDRLLVWLGGCDTRAVADLLGTALQKRLAARPARLDVVTPWAQSPHLWTRRMALLVTRDLIRQRHPKAADLARRDQALAMAGQMAADPAKEIQITLVDWLTVLGKHAPALAHDFLARHGAQMKSYALKSAQYHQRDH